MTQPTTHPDAFCTDLSAAAGEPLAGTVKQSHVWFLLEHPGPWGAQTLAESDLPQPLQDHLHSVPQSKVLLIRQEGPPRQDVRFFAALTREREPALFAYDLRAYEDLFELDLEAIASGEVGPTARVHSEPLFLVCTHGKRDRCCARTGLPVYRALAGAVSEAAWQCSHLGGHRFAANVVCLPHGLVYGRVEAGEVAALAEDYRRGRLWSEHLRGRACYEPPTQAAAILLRQQVDLDGLDDLTHVSTRALDDNSWETRFRGSGQGDDVHTLTLAADYSANELPQSCGSAKTAPVVTYRVAGHRAVG